jgi:hypothetical protein
MITNSITSSMTQKCYTGSGSIGGISLPDFDDDYVFTNKKSGISENEYKNKIIEQAYKDFADGKFQNESEGFNKLMKSYTSEISPDRKGIITSGLKAVARNSKNTAKPINVIATLLEGKMVYQKLPNKDTEYIEFYDNNGEMVATYSGNGWTMFTTKAEAARQTQMCTIYNEAWQAAKNGAVMTESAEAQLRELPDYLDDKPTFNLTI